MKNIPTELMVIPSKLHNVNTVIIPRELLKLESSFMLETIMCPIVSGVVILKFYHLSTCITTCVKFKDYD